MANQKRLCQNHNLHTLIGSQGKQCRYGKMKVCDINASKTYLKAVNSINHVILFGHMKTYVFLSLFKPVNRFLKLGKILKLYLNNLLESRIRMKTLSVSQECTSIDSKSVSIDDSKYLSVVDLPKLSIHRDCRCSNLLLHLYL